MKNGFLILCSFVLLWAACKKETQVIIPDPDPVSIPVPIPVPVDTIPKEKIIEIKTTFGNIYLWLHKGTPLHRANFLGLADTSYFDSTTFHRIVPGFVIQGGDPNSKDTIPGNDGEGGPLYTIPAEIDTAKFKHVYGAVGAARDNNPAKASSGSQFYIVIPKAGTPHLDGNYTVFGQVIKGMDVAERIVVQPHDANDRPNADIPMDVNVLEKTLQQLKDEFNFVP